MCTLFNLHRVPCSHNRHNAYNFKEQNGEMEVGLNPELLHQPQGAQENYQKMNIYKQTLCTAMKS